MSLQRIRIGTRGSELALAQAEETRARLRAALPAATLEIVPIVTSGDKNMAASLSDAGGKGLFTKEIEEALIGGTIDLAVHSMKDVPTQLPEGLVMAAFWEREDPRDVFLSPQFNTLEAMPPGGVIGTSSLRRTAQVKMVRPDLTVVPFRGNVNTRLRKLADGVAQATLLAAAGLNRIGRHDLTERAIPPDQFLPAVAQGAIGIECREHDAALRELLGTLSHAPTAICISAERAFLTVLDGSCRTPIAALGEISGNTLRLRGLIATPDGSRHHAAVRTGNLSDAEPMGREMGLELKSLGGPDFFSHE